MNPSEGVIEMPEVTFPLILFLTVEFCRFNAICRIVLQHYLAMETSSILIGLDTAKFGCNTSGWNIMKIYDYSGG